jgi:hypothetical protein
MFGHCATELGYSELAGVYFRDAALTWYFRLVFFRNDQCRVLRWLASTVSLNS